MEEGESVMSETMIKCRCCAAELFFADGEQTHRCGFCRTMNPRPQSQGDTLNIFNLATEQRMAQVFAQAEESYRQVLALQKDEYEARWGLVLCKYGVEYVEDMPTGARRPVCHKTQLKPMREDADYLRACELAPPDVRATYEADAAYIDAAQQRIRELRRSEPAYDIFICYKNTAMTSNAPTEERAIARRLYNELSRKGYRVFFAPESLSELAGENYEAGIYHAIETAKVMLVIGCKPEHLTSTWVQSEWMRYLERMDNGEDKHLVPLYSRMHASDLPQSFENRRLQALSMEKLTWQEELESALLRWLNKPEETRKAAAPQVETSAVQKILDNGATYIRLGDYDTAYQYYQTATKDYPEDYRGWWGLIVCSTKEFGELLPDQQQKQLNQWIEYIRRLAPSEAYEEHLKIYLDYTRKLAGVSSQEDIRTARSKIDSFNKQISQITANIQKTENEIKEREKQFQQDQERFEKFLASNDAEHKKAERKERNRKIAAWSGVGMFIIGAAMFLSSCDRPATESGVLFNCLAGLALCGIGVLVALMRAGSREELNTCIRISGQRHEAYENNQSREASYHKWVEERQQLITHYSSQIPPYRDKIAICQSFIDLGEGRITDYWYAEKCKAFGVQQSVDQQTCDKRQSMLSI